MRLPKKIENVPIIDAVVEIRFTTQVFPNAVFGMIYKKLDKDFPKTEKLPIMQIPEEIRDKDTGLKFKPHYKLTGENYSVSIGPDVIAVSSEIPYQGWTNYSKVIFNVLDKVFKSGIISSVTRLGMRYMNFLEFDVFKKINLGISIDNNSINYKNTLLKTELEEGGYNNTLQISNHAQRKINNKIINGSLIDIDTNRDYKSGSFNYNEIFRDEINSAHQAEKITFFKLLSKELLEELKPIY